MSNQLPQVNLQDIEIAVRVIDVAAKRGTFEGQELEPIGALRNRFAAILEANAKAQQPTPVPPADADADKAPVADSFTAQ